MNTVSYNHWHLSDQYAILSQPTHTSQLIHNLWWRWLNALHRCLHQPKAHLYVISVTHFMIFNTMSLPLFFPATNIGYPKPSRFCNKRVDALNHVSAFWCQMNWMYQTTWPHLTNQLQFHSTKGHHVSYMAQTRHLLNSQVLAIFSPSSTIPVTLHYSGFENSQDLRTDLYFLENGIWSCFTFFYIFQNLVHIRFQYISWMASPIQPPLPSPPSQSLNHTADLTDYLATIHSNNPVSFLSHCTN